MSAVDQLREEVERLRLEAEATALRAMLGQERRSRGLLEWGELLLDPLAALRGEEAYLGAGAFSPHVSRPHDRINGDFAPHFRNELELATIRGGGELLASSDAAAVGALEALTSYVIGVGYQQTATPKTPDDAQLARQCQGVLDEFYEREGWWGGLDAELFQRLRSAGECFVWLRPEAGGFVSVDVLEPSWVMAPPSPGELEAAYGLPVGLNWSYGVATAPRRPAQPLAYYVQLEGQASDEEVIDAAAMLHLRANVPRNVKRGLSDFYAGREWLDAVRKLLRNTLSGAAIQASIALLRKWDEGLRPGDIRSATDAAVEFVSSLPNQGGGGTRGVSTERYYPGKIVDVKGGDVAPGPMGTSAAGIYLQVVQAGLRQAALRWNMPEYMISGDASNANYASTLVAESPFVKFCERQQAVQAAAETRVSYRVIEQAVQAGRIAASGLEEIRARVTLDVETPQVATRDLLAEHQRRAGQYNAGLLSRQTWAAAEGLDYDEEQRRRGEEQPASDAPQMAALRAALGEARTLEEAAAALLG